MPSANPARRSPVSSSSATQVETSKSVIAQSFRQSRNHGNHHKLEIAGCNLCDRVYYDTMTLRTQHDKPVYVRLRETIADAILAGKFADGDPLPSVRALAAEERATPLTVAKAYQGFQEEWLIVVKRGVGMFAPPATRTGLRDSEPSPFFS